ncbi:STP1 protein [Plasmodium malariae]|uniref:STP1 protein n=1 Tax=Plasmodium malariae TaxID=5858 RepID=A0A1A8X6E4_PLAMA|nr:STP1 protein [Plasmodium malariae]
MDSCFSLNVPIFGNDAWRFRINPKFMKILAHIKEKTNSLKNEHNKQHFRNVCIELAEYLIKVKKEPPPLNRQDKWELALKHWLRNYFNERTRYGICPMILEEENKNILNLIYEAEDFCSEKNRKKPNCINTDKRSNKKCDSACLSKIQAYNAWINNRKIHFMNNADIVNRKCQKKNSLLPFPNNSCNVLNDKTFEEIPQCETSDPPILKQNEIKKEEKPSTEQDLTVSKEEYSQISPIQTEAINTGHPQSSSEPQEQVQIPSIESTDTQNVAGSAELLPVVTSIFLPNHEILSSGTSAESLSAASDTETLMLHQDQGTIASFPKELEPVSSTLISPALNNTQEDIIYDEEQIIKKLKIHEHDMIKNIKSSKQKKDRFKTIIEVHMEVLKEFRNEEWEHKKGEFLELCLEMFAEEEYRTYPNLSNGELIMENTKSINDIEKQKILCNKWIKEHRNISEKLKKTVWFNYLKNEWKKEKDFIKNSEKLKVNFSNKIQKDSFSGGEKDLWREWISKNRMIIDRYLEQEWDEEMTQELLNTIDELVNEKIKNNTILLNTEELQQKVSYDELYKYIKKKLLAKLCILVFMMVLEECKKEDFIENEELRLDSYINDWTTEVNLGRKSDVTKEIIEFNDNVLENTENTKIPAYTGKEGLSHEIEKWVRVEDTPENSIYNENIVE